jgi:hypothetical protein
MSKAGAWWGPFAEKASAKFYGNYDVMGGGVPEAAITILTGMPSKGYSFKSLNELQTWNIIKKFDDMKFIMTGVVYGMSNSYGLP